MYEKILQAAIEYQIMALNDEMLKSGCISQEEHDFIRSLRVKKLTQLNKQATM